MRMLTCEPNPDKEDVRQRSLLSRTNRTLRHMQSMFFSFNSRNVQFFCHLHEIKQVEAVNAEAEGVDATWMKMLV